MIYAMFVLRFWSFNVELHFDEHDMIVLNYNIYV